MKKIVLLLLLPFLGQPLQAQEQPSFSTTREWRAVPAMPDGGHVVRFTPLNKMRKAKAGADEPQFDHTKFKAVTLPIDWAKDFVFPMDGNDRYGDCYMAAMAHYFNTMYYNNGFNQAFSLGTFSTNGTGILNRYRILSGGDNGLNDGDIQNEGMTRYCADVKDAKFVSWANLDVTNPAAVQVAIQNYGAIFFTLGVPNAWINNSNTGAVWDAPATANQQNGHAVAWNGVDKDGKYKLLTWGTYVWITPAGVKSCDPAGWVAFSAKWFGTNGYAPNGVHIVDLAASWKAATSKEIPASVIASFPPPNVGPPPPPPTPPTPTQTLKSITLTYANGMTQTVDVVPAGVAAEFQKIMDLLTPPQVPHAQPNNGRILELEKNLGIMADEILKLQRIIQGAEDRKKQSSLPQRKVDYAQLRSVGCAPAGIGDDVLRARLDHCPLG